jgi:signal transduction histidine kinase
MVAGWSGVRSRAAGRPAPALALDLIIAAAAVAGVVRTWVQPESPRSVVTVLALLASLPLLLRHRYPMAAPLTALAGCAGLSLVVPGAVWEQLQFFFCALLCAWVIGSENPRGRALGGLGAVLAGAVVTVAYDPLHTGVGDYVFAVTITAAAWTGGLLFGGRARQAAAAEQLAAERERQAVEAVAAERARIARELHDVIAHTVSVMVVQAGAAQQVLGPGNEQVQEALDAIRESGKGALVELRRMLGLLRDDDPGSPPAPQPSLADVEQLVAQVAAAGADIEVTRSGVARPLSSGLDQTSYRIVQEALTNTLKHAAPARATVGICWEPDALVLSVTDDGGRGSGGYPSPGGGRGIVGMRERAHLYGGDLVAGPRPEGGFAVTARLPA